MHFVGSVIPGLDLKWYIQYTPLIFIFQLSNICSNSPFPRVVVIPFINWVRVLLGEIDASELYRALLLNKSIFPVCWRNFSSSRERRLNCSLWIRHFSSSSRTLAYKKEQLIEQNTELPLIIVHHSNGLETRNALILWIKPVWIQMLFIDYPGTSDTVNRLINHQTTNT